MNNIIDKLKNHVLTVLGLNIDIDLHEENFSRIREEVYLGSRPKFEQIETLKQEGITHIVSCLNVEKVSEVAFLKNDFQTIFLPLKDGIHENISTVLPSFIEFISTSLDNSPRGKILVHCEVGVSRSATLVIALLMLREHKSFYDAFLDVREKRTKVLPNIGFASQLQRLEHANNSEKPVAGTISSLAKYLHQICHVPIEIMQLQSVLEAHQFKALPAIHAIFGEDIPRVIQGIRL